MSLLLAAGMDVPIMVVTPEQYGAGYVEAIPDALGGGRPPLVNQRRFRMVCRREDGNYVVVDPAVEWAKQTQARMRLNEHFFGRRRIA